MSRLTAGLSALTSGSGLRRVMVAYGLYDLVEFSIWLAILLYAYAIGGATLAGLVGVAQLVPAMVIVPLLAGIGDRMPRGRALVVAHAFVAVSTLLTGILLIVAAPVGAVIVASTLCTTSVALVRPIHFAALPQLALRPAELVSANALSSMLDGVGLFLGPVIAGVMAELVGTWFVFVVGSALSMAAAFLCRNLGLAAAVRPTDGSQVSEFRAAVEGLVSLWRDWGALALLVVMGAKFVLEGALDVAGVAFSESVLGAGAASAGLIIGSVGLGGLVGAAIGSFASTRRLLAPVVLAGGVLAGLGLAAVSTLGALAPVMVMLALTGMGATLVMVSGRTLLQRATDDRILARVFAVQEGTSLLGLALGAAIAPVLIDRISPAGAFVPLGLGMMLLTVGVIGFIRRLDARSVYLPAEVGLLRGISILSALPPSELERLAKNAHWRQVDPGDEIVRQGDAGEEFYAIGAGTFTVTADGNLLPHRLGPGQGFGEIALLHAVPRTATVTAATAGRLLAVRSSDFLAAVSGSVDGRALGDEIAREDPDPDPDLEPA